jgi:hypothetical protein
MKWTPWPHATAASAKPDPNDVHCIAARRAQWALTGLLSSARELHELDPQASADAAAAERVGEALRPRKHITRGGAWSR